MLDTSFECKPGCHDCCGIVPFTAAEMRAAQSARPLVAFEPFGESTFVPTAAMQTFSCPFVTGSGCGIYAVRPMICRLFGAVDSPNMTCPHGCRPKALIADADARKMLSASEEKA